MSANTPNRAYTYPSSTDNYRPHTDMQELATDIDTDMAAQVVILTASPRGVLYYGQRATAVGPTSGTTVLGILRIDSMTLKSGRIYRVDVGPLRPDLTVATDRVKFTIRYSSAGAATIASTVIGRSERSIPATSGSEDLNTQPSPSALILPGSDTSTASVLLAMERPSGTGTISITSPGTIDEGIWMTVTDMGLAASDTGVDV